MKSATVTSNATAQQIWDAVRQVYEKFNMTEYLDALKEQIQNFAEHADEIKDWGKW